MIMTKKIWYSIGFIYIIFTSNKIIDTYYIIPNLDYFKKIENKTNHKYNLWKYGILGN
jgi:hypothetical protein